MINKKERAAMDRYGLDPSDYSFGGKLDTRDGDEKDYNQMQEDFTRAARNDYDTRRGLEAMAMSGKKKAKKLAEGGLNSVSDVMNANNMQAKAHKKAGMGGSFSSASDFAGVSYRAVERDRRKHDQDIDGRISSMKDSLLKKAKPEKEEEEAPVELSDRAQAASDFESYEFNPMDSDSNDIFGEATNEQVEGGTIDFSDSSDKAYDPTKGESSPAAGAFLANRKEDYKEGMKRAGVTGRGAGSLNF